MALPRDLHPPIPAARRSAADARLLVVRDSGTSIWASDGSHRTPEHADLALAAALHVPDGVVLSGTLDGATFTVEELLAIDHQDVRSAPVALRRVRLEALAAEWTLDWRLAADAAPIEPTPTDAVVAAQGRRRRGRAARLALEPSA